MNNPKLLLLAELQLQVGGTLVPVSLAHRLIGVSRTRFDQFTETKLVRTFNVEGWRMVPVPDLVLLDRARQQTQASKRRTALSMLRQMHS